MTFKVGDRVVYNADGDKGTITRFEQDKIWISWDDANEAEAWASEDEISKFSSYGSGAPGALENFAKTAAKFANDPISREDAEKLKDLGEQLGISSFEQSVRYHTNKIADLLIAKNKAYGDSALNPVRIFSKASRIEQLNVRIDDKISRIQRGTDFGDEDTVRDLVGYLLLRLIAEESE